MKILDIINRAKAVIAKLPERRVEPSTEDAYRKAFVRLWRKPVLDPLADDIALDTYYQRRAVLHYIGRSWLQRLTDKCLSAGERRDLAAVQRVAGVLLRAVQRIEPAIERDPPWTEGSPLQSPYSRWAAQPGARPQRGANSKKHVLPLLPADWDRRLWQAALLEWNEPANRKNLDALAVELLVPVRPIELSRPGDVVVELKSTHRLEISILPAKNHGGRYGTEVTTIGIDPVKAGGPAAHLAARCSAHGARLAITVARNAHRKMLDQLGRIALPECDVTITANVCRSQVIADLKATWGAGAEVAAAAGHCTDRTQSRYGHVAHGRKRRGLIGVESKRAPRAENVKRARELGTERRPRRRPRK